MEAVHTWLGSAAATVGHCRAADKAAVEAVEGVAVEAVVVVKVLPPNRCSVVRTIHLATFHLT